MIKGSYEDPPPDNPSLSCCDTQVNVPTTGALWIVARDSATLQCAGSGGGGCTSHHGLYIDRKAVPHSGLSFTGAESQKQIVPITLFGIANVTAGMHTVQIGEEPTGNWLGTNEQQVVISAALLGGAVVAVPTSASGPARRTNIR